MSKEKLTLADLIDKLIQIKRILLGYSVLIFVLFIAGLYGFILFRISSLTNAQPSSSAVSGQVQAAQIPHIDKNVLNQLESLQNNSVNVQSLFNNARSNPFQ